MRKNFGAKPWTYPQPVFILATYNEDGTPNAMNAAWGGISEDKELSMCISAEHKTTANILANKAVNFSEFAYANFPEEKLPELLKKYAALTAEGIPLPEEIDVVKFIF